MSEQVVVVFYDYILELKFRATLLIFQLNFLRFNQYNQPTSILVHCVSLKSHNVIHDLHNMFPSSITIIHRIKIIPFNLQSSE